MVAAWFQNLTQKKVEAVRRRTVKALAGFVITD
jgi:hypothetical protein